MTSYWVFMVWLVLLVGSCSVEEKLGRIADAVERPAQCAPR